MQFSFHDDLNIISIYNDVINLLQQDITNIDKLELDMKIMKTIISRSENPSDVLAAEEKLSLLSTKIRSIHDGTYIKVFKDAVNKYILEYINITPSVYIFGIDTCKSIPRRVYLINQFLEIVSGFVHIEWRCTYSIYKICTNCYELMAKCGSIMKCSKCGHSYSIMESHHIYIEDGVLYKPTTYYAPKNFRKVYSTICGRTHSVKDNEIADIDTYLYRSAIYEPTRDDVRMAISACGYTNYNDTNYIYSELTNSPLPPLEQYIDIFTDRYTKYYNIFKTIDVIGHNTTNINFLTKLFLWQEDVKYDISWFRTLADATEEKHRSNAKKICKVLQLNDILNWRYPPEWDISTSIEPK